MKCLVVYAVLCIGCSIRSDAKEASEQLRYFAMEHPTPIGVWTTSAGRPVDIRDVYISNSDTSKNPLLFESLANSNGERIPERSLFPKGTGAFGYFEVTHDVSEYTYADVFNGVGKRTPILTRFSNMFSRHGGSDVSREIKGMSVKFYTKHGNLDLLGHSVPIFGYKHVLWQKTGMIAYKTNAKSDVADTTAMWDVATLIPEVLNGVFWIFSDYSVPATYRNMDAFPVHTYELVNKHGDTHYARFSFRSEAGFIPITAAEAAMIQGLLLDFHKLDLYNNVEALSYNSTVTAPSWRLEMDVMTKRDLLHVDYDPFDPTRLWKNGTFLTVQIGRLVLTRNPDNHFSQIEQAAFNPGNLVPGIPGPVGQAFGHMIDYYKDAASYRLGRNHNNILINLPLYSKDYQRDGERPLLSNGRDAPNYYPNSFNGPMPYVEENRPHNLVVLQSNAVDLEPMRYFINHLLRGKGQRARLVQNIAASLVTTRAPVFQRAMDMLELIDMDFKREVEAAWVTASRLFEAAKEIRPRLPITPVPNHEG